MVHIRHLGISTQNSCVFTTGEKGRSRAMLCAFYELEMNKAKIVC